MAVGRASNKSGGSAIGVLNLDNTAEAGVLKKITENEAIQSAVIIKLPTINALPDWLS